MQISMQNMQISMQTNVISEFPQASNIKETANSFDLENEGCDRDSLVEIRQRNFFVAQSISAEICASTASRFRVAAEDVTMLFSKINVKRALYIYIYIYILF